MEAAMLKFFAWKRHALKFYTWKLQRAQISRMKVAPSAFAPDRATIPSFENAQVKKLSTQVIAMGACLTAALWTGWRWLSPGSGRPRPRPRPGSAVTACWECAASSFAAFTALLVPTLGDSTFCFFPLTRLRHKQ